MLKNVSHNQMAALGWLLHASGLGVMVALVSAAVCLLYWPIEVESRRLETAVSLATEYEEQHASVATQRDQLLELLSERQQTQSDLVSRVPSTISESEFLAQLAQLARSTGVEISQYSPSQPNDEASHGSLDIELKAQAPYNSICRFLNGIEDLPRLCRAKSLRIVAPEAGSNECRLEMTLQIFFTVVSARNEHGVRHG